MKGRFRAKGSFDQALLTKLVYCLTYADLMRLPSLGDIKLLNKALIEAGALAVLFEEDNQNLRFFLTVFAEDKDGIEQLALPAPSEQTEFEPSKGYAELARLIRENQMPQDA